MNTLSKITWPARLPFDVAMGESDEKLCVIYGITKEQLNDIMFVDAFRRAVADHKREIAENGITFRKKAKIQAEEYLVDMHDLISDVETPPSVKLNAIQSIVRWAGLEPEKDKGATVNVNTNTKIEICWGNPETGEIIDI